jgi:uncharacterized protein HemY
MFVVHDMVVEIVVVAVVLAIVLLAASVLAATCREWLDRRRAHRARARLRRAAWRDYAAACVPAQAEPMATRAGSPAPGPAVTVRGACDQRAGLTAGPAKA